MANPKRIPHKFKPWIALRQKHSLSHEHVQMARELQLDPQNLHHAVRRGDPIGKLPYPEMIETLYREKFGRDRPIEILSVEEMAAQHLQRRQQRKMDRQAEGKSVDHTPDEA